MNINPFGPTKPHYDSYDDFYKFFEIYPKDVGEGMPIEVFPLVEPKQIEKPDKVVEDERNIEKI